MPLDPPQPVVCRRPVNEATDMEQESTTILEGPWKKSQADGVPPAAERGSEATERQSPDRLPSGSPVVELREIIARRKEKALWRRVSAEKDGNIYETARANGAETELVELLADIERTLEGSPAANDGTQRPPVAGLSDSGTASPGGSLE